MVAKQQFSFLLIRVGSQQTCFNFSEKISTKQKARLVLVDKCLEVFLLITFSEHHS